VKLDVARSAVILFENGYFFVPRYPKKIQAKYGLVNELAIEALEMHFRVHASILKYLENHCVETDADKNHYDVADDDVSYVKGE